MNMLNNFSRLNSAINPNNVGFVIFYVTNVCNFRCNFCFYSEEINKGVKNDQLTLDEIEKLSKGIGPLVQLSLTGGEPFLRKDFTEVADILVKNTKTQYVTVPTNGSLPDRVFDFYNYLLKKHPDTFFRCVLSIEGIHEEHDKLRGVKGSFRKIIKSYEKLQKLRREYKNLIIDSNSVFTINSEDSLLDTVKYLNKNFKFDNISVTYARGDIPDENLKSKSKSKYIEINNYLESIERTKEKRRFSSVMRGINALTRDHVMGVAFDNKFITPCVASKKIVVISETGDVYPCEILKEKLGNLRDFEYDTRKILKQEKNKEIKDWIKNNKCKCTFECAAAASIVWNPKNYFNLFKHSMRSYFRDR